MKQSLIKTWAINIDLLNYTKRYCLKNITVDKDRNITEQFFHFHNTTFNLFRANALNKSISVFLKWTFQVKKIENSQDNFPFCIFSKESLSQKVNIKTFISIE